MSASPLSTTNYRRARRHTMVPGDPLTATVVIDVLLHEGRQVVFRGHDYSGSAIRCVGGSSVLRAPVPGETWTLQGEWQHHREYGDQLVVAAATLVRPSGQLFVQAISRNVRDFPGIGVARAEKVWNEHESTAFDHLAVGDPAPFVPQLGDDLAQVLVAGWRALDEEAKAYGWLTQHGFPFEIASTVARIYSAVPVPPEHTDAAARMGRVAWHLSADPYRMLAFASWKTTDATARLLGIGANDARRLVGSVEAAAGARLADGHTWLDPADLRQDVARKLGLPISDADVGVQQAVESRALIEHAGGYQLPGVWVMERSVADRVTRMRLDRDVPSLARSSPVDSRAKIEMLLDTFDRTQHYVLSAEQRAAVWMGLTEPISLLLGGPGVGKTTVLRALHYTAEASGQTIYQAALAGRAAKRMIDATGRPAMTIAMLLRQLDRGEIRLNDEPLIIVDEASMIDLATMYRLLLRCPDGVRILLVGDPGQLPPIGFGLVLHVLGADSGPTAVPRTRLTVPRRQTEASGIPRVCEAIRRGEVPTLHKPDWSRPEGVSFVKARPTEVTETIVALLGRFDDGVSVQVVGSVKARVGGIDEINRRLQKENPATSRPQLNGRFFVGDPVLVTRNDYGLGIMNGDLGSATSNAEAGGLHCRFDDGEKMLPASLLRDHVELAYAITCHKAQGSQFPTVVVPVTPSRLLDRTLLLTAISRAEQRVILVGDPAIFAEAIMREPKSDVRRVGLGRVAALT